MKSRITTLLCALMALCMLMPVAAQDAAELLNALRDDNYDTRQDAARKLAPMGAEVVVPLADLMAGEDLRLGKAAGYALGLVCYHAAGPEGTELRADVAKAVADVAVSDRPKSTRVSVIRMLAFVGGAEVLPAMWDLLMFQPEYHEIARWALIRMPVPEAVGTLKQAVGEVGDPAKEAGLLDALAARASVDMYTIANEALKSNNAPVRLSALNLLAQIPDAAGADTLARFYAGAQGPEKSAAAQALLALGDTLIGAGKPSSARSIYARLSDSDDMTLRAAGIAGIGRAGGPGAAELLVQGLLASDDADVRGAARHGLVELDADDVTERITAALAGADVDAKTSLVAILGDRGDTAGRAAVLNELGNDDEGVRAAALRALATLADPNAYTLKAMLGAMAGGADELLAAGEWSLNRMEGAEVGEALAGLLDSSPAEMKPLILRTLGNRGRAEAAQTQALLAALDDTDGTVRLAAIEGLRRLRSPATVDALIAQLDDGDDEVDAVEKALAAFNSPEAVAKLVTAVEATETTPAIRARLVKALAPREDAALFDTFAKAADDADDATAVAALDALGRLRDQKAAPLFLKRIENGSPDVRGAAVRGYLVIAEAREKEDGDAALAIYTEALGMEVGEGEKRTALRGLGRLANMESLAIIEPYLDNEKLRADAAAAALPMAVKLRDQDKDRAVALLTRVVDSTGDRNVIRDAAKALREVGVDLKIAASKGCITNWWVTGPVRGRERATKEDVLPTDQPVDVTQAIQDGDETYEWKYAPTDDPLGHVDFEKVVARMNDCGAYAYAVVESDAERDVKFKLGSDDGASVWLNGERVFNWEGNRGWSQDQDTFDGHLKAGENTVLCKVINGGAQWALSLRITDADGTPIVLPQREP